MLLTLGMGWRLLVRTRLLVTWLAGMALMGYLEVISSGIDRDQLILGWVVLLTAAPAFACSQFAREYLAWEPSLLSGGAARQRFRRLFVLLCGLAGAVGAAARPESAPAMAALAFGGVALAGAVTLRFARGGMLVGMLTVLWPMFIVPPRAGAWVLDNAWIGLAVGAASSALFLMTLADATWHRRLCSRRGAQLGDWWDIDRVEKRGATRHGSPSISSWMLSRARAATLAGHQRAAQMWQGAFPVVTCGRTVPARFANNTAGAIVVIAVALYADSFVAGRSGMRGWFAGMIVMPALSLLPGIVRLGHRNGVLLSRKGRHRVGQAIGVGSVLLSAGGGALLWTLGTVLAGLIPAWTFAGREWVCTAPPLHALILVPVVAPAQLLVASIRRGGSTGSQLQLGFPLFLMLHGVLSMTSGASVFAAVAGLPMATFLAFVLVWRQRCLHADLPE